MVTGPGGDNSTAEIIEANACNEENYCQQDDVALLVVVGVQIWAIIIVIITCWR